MKATLIINNQELEVEISEEEYKKLQPEKKKTGYERVNEGDTYYYGSYRGGVEYAIDDRCPWDDEPYNTANYYSSEVVAQDNARADKLIRQLRRFAVEYREKELDWNDSMIPKYQIIYDYHNDIVDLANYHSYRPFGSIFFDSKAVAKSAIDIYHDELIWYFTEYKDSL